MYNGGNMEQNSKSIWAEIHSQVETADVNMEIFKVFVLFYFSVEA